MSVLNLAAAAFALGFIGFVLSIIAIGKLVILQRRLNHEIDTRRRLHAEHARQVYDRLPVVNLERPHYDSDCMVINFRSREDAQH